jgi:alanine dehydrogenase
VLDDDDIHGSVGEIVIGEKPGRVAADGITVFDSTGLAIQDVAAARIAYEHAAAADAGYAFDFLGVG